MPTEIISHNLSEKKILAHVARYYTRHQDGGEFARRAQLIIEKRRVLIRQRINNAIASASLAFCATIICVGFATLARLACMLVTWSPWSECGL